ncbi:GMC oxidoreductase [Aspergillus recurvatus]
MYCEQFDYIIVGGGLAGSVLASRLSHSDNKPKVLLVEAGPDVSKNEVIPYANNTAILMGSELDWGYRTVPQENLNGRQIANPAGKCLGGGTAINACGWTRGHHTDFDQWAELVGDQRYTYKNLLPYFVRTEEYYDADITPGQHGSQGPMYVATPSSTGRWYPLRKKLARAWRENNVQPLPGLDGNTGCPIGLAELAENRRNGLRQLASSVYPLDDVHVLTNTLVKRILIEQTAPGSLKPKPAAVGIETADGKQYRGGEIIAAAGSYRTPQLLMLSGIGPRTVLSGLDIPVILDNPDVGRNLYDHLQLTQYWRLKDGSAGYALGSEDIRNNPEYGLGVPIDWVINTDVPKKGLAEVIAVDMGRAAISSSITHHPLLKSKRAILEHLVVYAAASAADPAITLDGSHIASTIVHLLPTSKGTVTINSTDPASKPLIDPQYLSTEADYYAWRVGLRTTAQLFLGTETGRAFVESETPPDAFKRMTLDTEDEYLNARVRHGAFSTYHPTSTCSMGKVVDADFRVLGISNLRVVDASVVPLPIAAHIQATVYALAELAAATISGKA